MVNLGMAKRSTIKRIRALAEHPSTDPATRAVAQERLKELDKPSEFEATAAGLLRRYDQLIEMAANDPRLKARIIKDREKHLKTMTDAKKLGIEI
jgi:hypothetical protein